jgi:hypothetical protein
MVKCIADIARSPHVIALVYSDYEQFGGFMACMKKIPLRALAMKSPARGRLRIGFKRLPLVSEMCTRPQPQALERGAGLISSSQRTFKPCAQPVLFECIANRFISRRTSRSDFFVAVSCSAQSTPRTTPPCSQIQLKLGVSA